MIDAGKVRFNQTKQHNHELNLANLNLEEQQVIERAKGILMRQRNLDEDTSYEMLLEMANRRKMKLVDMSKQLIDTAQLLTV